MMKIKSSLAIKVAASRRHPPYSFIEDGASPEAVDVELAKVLAPKLGRGSAAAMDDPGRKPSTVICRNHLWKGHYLRSRSDRRRHVAWPLTTRR